MLLSAQIGGFRSCENVRLENIQNVLLLVGRNGVGKTNVLKAIEWAARTASAVAPIESDEASSRMPCEVTLRLRLNGQVIVYSVRLLREAGRKEGGLRFLSHYLVESMAIEGGRIVFFREKGDLTVGDIDPTSLKVGFMTPAAYSILSLVPKHESAELLAYFVSFAKAIRYYPLEEFEAKESHDFVSLRDYEAWRGGESGSAKNANETLVLKLLDLYLQKRATFDELSSLLGPEGLDIINKITVTEFEVPIGSGDLGAEANGSKKMKYYFVEFSPARHRKESEFAFASLSFGTRRIVRLLTALLFDDTTVSLIEQPEDGIHAGLLHKLVPLLNAYADPRQFIITSHSSQVLNQAKPEQIRIVDLEEGVTTLRALDATEVTAAENFINGDGPMADFLETVQGS